MKTRLSSAIVVAASIVSGSALAAEMPVKAPAPAPTPPFSWTACYIGAHAGGGWAHKRFTDRNLFTVDNEEILNSTNGWIAGGQIGCDYQFASAWVVGVEGAGSWTNIKGDVRDPFVTGDDGTPIIFQAKTEWLASATARLGYAWDRVLLYAKGGAAWAGDRYRVSGVVMLPFDFRARESRFGWTAGGGIEWAPFDNWSVKLEYDFFDFGRHATTLVDVTGNFVEVPDFAEIKQQIHTIRFGVNYRFWTGYAPVAAKY